MRPFHPERIPRPRIDREVLQGFLAAHTTLDLEIGAGAGWHALSRSRGHPERGLIAIERTVGKFERFFGRFARHGSPSNLLPLHADAVGVAVHDLPAGRFQNIFFLYPNPEPKNPAQRWIRAPFFARVLELLAPGGRIHFATNETFYHRELLEKGPADWGLRVFSDRRIPPARKDEARTHFEKKYLARGQTCFEIVFESSV